jgi:hypothetical protein
MHICRTALAVSMAVALGGALWAGFADWSAAAVYGVGFASILVYFLAAYWIDERPRKRRVSGPSRQA